MKILCQIQYGDSVPQSEQMVSLNNYTWGKTKYQERHKVFQNSRPSVNDTNLEYCQSSILW